MQHANTETWKISQINNKRLKWYIVLFQVTCIKVENKALMQLKYLYIAYLYIAAIPDDSDYSTLLYDSFDFIGQISVLLLSVIIDFVNNNMQYHIHVYCEYFSEFFLAYVTKM